MPLLGEGFGLLVGPFLGRVAALGWGHVRGRGAGAEVSISFCVPRVTDWLEPSSSAELRACSAE